MIKRGFGPEHVTKFWTHELLASVVEMHNLGFTIRQIARSVQVSKSSVHRKIIELYKVGQEPYRPSYPIVRPTILTEMIFKRRTDE